MGYTHYWRHTGTLNGSIWKIFQMEVRNILTDAAAQGIELEVKEVGPDAVHFNGVGRDAHEDFCFTRDGTGWDCCKTTGRAEYADKPYDAVVCACLISAAVLFGSSVKVSSDGDWDPDWSKGLELYTSATGFGGTTSVLKPEE